MKTFRKSPTEPLDEYLELVRALPLRVIRGAREHQEAVAVLSRLIGREGVQLSGGARQYADALTRFIQDYEQKAYPMLAAKRSAGTKLKYVMTESATTPGRIAEILGASQPLVSLILAGKRSLTTAHLRKLGAYFKIDPGYFL